MQMTSKLEEPGRKAAIINKTKRKDEGTGPGVLAGGDQKNGVWRKAGICTNKKATRSPSRSSLLRRESRRKKEREQTPPHTPETVHKRERKTRARTHGDILRVMNMIIGQETTPPTRLSGKQHRGAHTHHSHLQLLTVVSSVLTGMCQFSLGAEITNMPIRHRTK
ncbi:PREDICTED: uncharacterized protein LOC105577024 [Cercocebus atys]|uniref:uncharacterized protein LOC105577024 n=1 Tax=Cercocebus atys TaxID=9531 RepID=UPI0005F5873A|nr:PREDICTED: uncharacterized protein LOC105577024 [Cercocebus atys]XP_011896110.1 PREDICTED: uncharacterized protein LOC105577024 [Cercocebus atys]